MHIRPILFSISCLALMSTSAIAQTPSILVCRAKQCAEAGASMSREYLFNQLAKLMDKNIGKDILLCEADPTSHVCLQNGLSFPAQSAMIQTNISIPTAKLVDSKILPGATGLDLILDYKIKAGDTFPRCQTALSRLGVASANTAQMMSPQFSCRLTETGSTILSIVYNIDYVDFDYGTLGAYYSAASGQALPGGKNGYLLMRFTQPSPVTTTDTFPMNGAPQQALDMGQMHTQMEAIWMKPTPFLNLETPVFMPEGCMDGMGNCSAELLNTVSSVPTLPSAQPSPLPSTAGVASTTGIIEQTKTILPPSKGITQTVTTRKQISEEGKPVYVEEEVRRFVQESPDGPLVEDTAAASKKATGSHLDQTENTGTTEAAAVEQAPQATDKKNEMPAEQAQTATVASHLPIQPAQPNVLMVPQMPKPAVLPQDGYSNGAAAAIEIVTPEGITLTAEEQAYIQQLPLPPEAMNIGNGTPQPNGQGFDPNFATQQQEIVIENSGIAPMIETPFQEPAVQPIQQAVSVETPQPTVSETPTQSTATQEGQQATFWDKVEKYMYF